MTRHKRTLFATIIYLAFIFNIERLDFGSDNPIDIQSFVYALTLGSFVTILAVPFFRRTSVWVSLAFWNTIGLVIKLVLGRPLLGGVYTYLSITEAALFSIAIVLAHELALTLHDFEEAVRNITLAGVSKRVQKMSDAAEEIDIELIRSRRHNRPLTVVVVEPDAKTIQIALHRSVKELQEAMMARYVVTGLARVISNELRRTDLVIDQHDEGRFIIFSPETKPDEASKLIERIQSAATKSLGVSLKHGRASFPQQAVTFDELVRQAELEIDKATDSARPILTSSEARGEV